MHKTYELMVLLHPDLEIDVEAPIAKVEGLVEAAGGKVAKRDNWGKKRLAYRIGRQDFAIYVYFEIELEPTQVSQLEKTIQITEEVLRHLLVIHEQEQEHEEAKKPADKKVSEKVAEKTSDKVADNEDEDKGNEGQEEGVSNGKEL